MISLTGVSKAGFGCIHTPPPPRARGVLTWRISYSRYLLYLLYRYELLCTEYLDDHHDAEAEDDSPQLQEAGHLLGPLSGEHLE